MYNNIASCVYTRIISPLFLVVPSRFFSPRTISRVLSPYCSALFLYRSRRRRRRRHQGAPLLIVVIVVVVVVRPPSLSPFVVASSARCRHLAIRPPRARRRKWIHYRDIIVRTPTAPPPRPRVVQRERVPRADGGPLALRAITAAAAAPSSPHHGSKHRRLRRETIRRCRIDFQRHSAAVASTIYIIFFPAAVRRLVIAPARIILYTRTLF